MSFGDFNEAARMRSAIEKIVDGRIRLLRPEVRVAEVLDINTSHLTASIRFAGDTGSMNARFGKSLQPSAVGNLVRVAGKPGDYYITEILNAAGVHETYQPLPGKVANLEIEAGAVDQKIDDAVNAYDFTLQAQLNTEFDNFNDSLNTKSQHYLSPNAPTTSTPNNAGDVWEQHATGEPTEIIARWRGMGGTGTPPVAPYTWSPMNLDATYIPLLDIGSGTFGDLSGTRIVAQTIGVEKLLVGIGLNQIANAGAETGSVTPHVGSGATWSVVTNPIHSGKYGFRGVMPAIPGTAYVLTLNGARTDLTQKMPVELGDVVRTYAWVRIGTSGSGAGAYVYIDQHKSDGSIVNNVYDPSQPGEIRNVTLTTSYQKIVAEVTITDPLVTHVGSAVAGSGTASGDIFHVDDLYLGKKHKGELLVDGTIFGRHIAANEIGVEKLLVTDFTDFVRDPSMEGIGTWNLLTGWSYSTSSPRAGDANGKHLRFATTGSYSEVSEPVFKVTPDDEFRFFGLYRRAGTLQASGTLYFRVYWKDAASSPLSYTETSVAVSSITDTSWRSVGFNCLAPAGARFAQVQLIASTVPAGGVYDFDEIHVRRRFGGELVVDGTILTHHLGAESITADKLGVNAVQAKHISIGDFTNLITESNAWTAQTAGTIVTGGSDTTGPFVVIEGNGSGNSFARPAVYDIPCNSGDEFHYYMRIFGNYAGFTGSGTPYFQWLTGTKALVNSVPGTAVNQGSGYVVREGDLVAPSTAKYLRVIPYVTASMKIAIRDWWVRRKNEGSLLVDGAIYGKLYKTNTGFDDIEIVPGDVSTPSALRFMSDGVGIDNALPASLSTYDGSQALGGVNSYYMTMTLQGPKYSSATTRSRIDFTTWRHIATAANVQADIAYHAGGAGTLDGGHYFYIDNNLIGHFDQTGLTLQGTERLGVGVASSGLSNGEIRATGPVKGATLYGLNMFPSTEQPVYVNSTGLLKLQASSERFKEEIELIQLEVAKGFLAVDGVSFRHTEEYDPDDTVRRRRPGMLAERLVENNLDLWVYFDSDGLPAGIDYPAVTAAHNVLIRDLYDQIAELKRGRN